MRAIRDQRGFTLIELLVSMAITFVIMGCVVTILTVFLNDTRYDGLRDQAQDDSRSMVDQLSRDLRSAASPKPDNSGLLQTGSSGTNIVFQSVIPGGSSTSSNAYAQQWVRYCLDSNETVWRQTQSIATSSTEPDESACPSTSSGLGGWAQASGSPCCKVATDITNDIGGDSRNLFNFLDSSGATTSTLSNVHEVEVNVWTDLNPDHLPGPSPQLQTGIYLRNSVSPPTAAISLTQTPNSGNTQADVLLNGSSSSDPQGQTLTFQWYANSGTTGCSSITAGPSTGALANGTTEVYDAGDYTTGTTETFALVVTNTGGLTSCQTYPTVTIK
jgi:type II secretory pathway pseudopilin PulG